MSSTNDILVWEDGTWCFRDELHEYSFMSDDYSVIPDETPEWDAHLSNNSKD